MTADVHEPVFVVGCGRSGTSLVLSHLERSGELWTVGRDSTHVWNQVDHPLHSDDGVPAQSAVTEMRRSYGHLFSREAYRFARDLTDDEVLIWLHRLQSQGIDPHYCDVPGDVVRSAFGPPTGSGPSPVAGRGESAPYALAHSGRRPTPTEHRRPLRVVDKDTRHVYRLPLLRAMYPDARFVFVHRARDDVLTSLIRAWRHPRFFFSYRLPLDLEIDGYHESGAWARRWWNLALPPDWSAWRHRSLTDVCEHQWQSANQRMLDEFDELDRRGQVVAVDYDRVVADPARQVGRIADLLELGPRGRARAIGPVPLLVPSSDDPVPDRLKRPPSAAATMLGDELGRRVGVLA